MPTLAEAIVKGEQDGTYTGARLTGIAVGNGCTGTEVGICGSGPQGMCYHWSYLIIYSLINIILTIIISISSIIIYHFYYKLYHNYSKLLMIMIMIIMTMMMMMMMMMMMIMINSKSFTNLLICFPILKGTYYEWSYLLQTAFIDSDLKAKINTACDWAAAAKNTVGALSLQCVGLLNSASQEISNVDLYNIYGDCVNDSGCSTSATSHKPRGKVPVRNEIIVEEAGNVKRLLGGRIIPHGPDACIDSGAASAYLNQDSVMTAIHVKNPGYCWSVCGTAPTWDYNSTRTNLPLNTYPLLVSNINVVIFNGDWDACVPYTDNEAWTEGN